MNPRHNREGSVTSRLTKDTSQVRRIKPSKVWVEAIVQYGGGRELYEATNIAGAIEESLRGPLQFHRI